MVELIIVETLVYGGIYALLAIGFSLIFGNARVINLAHTAFFMLAAYGLWYFMRRLGIDTGWAILITVPAVTLLGILAYRFLINPIREHLAAVLLMTVALAIAFQQLMLAIFSSYYWAIPALIPGFKVILGVSVSNQQLLTLGIVAVVVIIVWLILAKTKLGIALRATAQDAEVANLMGISVPRTLMITMGIATALAAIAAVAVTPIWIISPDMWSRPLVMVMVVVVLGGLGSIKGAIIGAFIVALVENSVTVLLPEYNYLSLVCAILAMVIVLIVRPGGLFGILFEEEKL
ncbi:MAG TPA: branched-chain amino acid ABC transporter permease [Dehalococcoidia bacterium]|nr:branched-chain amino acid ABC transporter permease [Dehalococcoidia bacterium]